MRFLIGLENLDIFLVCDDTTVFLRILCPLFRKYDGNNISNLCFLCLFFSGFFYFYSSLPRLLSFEYVLELEKGGQFLLIFDNKTEKLPKVILM